MSRRTILRVQDLDGRILPSVAILTTPGGTAQTNTAAQSPTLYGNLYGHWKVESPHPDVGQKTDFEGSGELTGVGHVTVTGSITAVGMIANGNAVGKLTIKTTDGHITLHLTGPSQPGFAALPDSFDFSTSDAKGSLKELNNTHGRLYIHRNADGTYSMAIRPSDPGRGTGLSGVRGTVRIGPVSPVVKPGDDGIRPLPGAIISVRRKDGTEVAHGTAGFKGEFTLAVDPGTYTIIVSPPHPDAMIHPYHGTLVVRTGQYTHLDVTLDSGIR